MQGNEGFFIVVPVLFLTAIVGAIATILWILKKKKNDPQDPPENA